MAAVATDIPLLRSLLTLASVIEARDPYTGGHIWRVSRYARALAVKLGIDRKEIFKTELGGLVHDLGKLGVPDAILGKHGRLTPDEFAIIKTHPEVGRNLIASHPMAHYVIEIVFRHHERMDGNGYPGGLSGEELPLTGRIVSIADAFDAMTSTRSYQPRMTAGQAYQIIEREKGKQFDKQFAEVFLELGRGGALDHIIGHCGDARLMLNCPVCGPIIAPTTRHKDGSAIYCPSCSGEFILHAAGERFELQSTGKAAQARGIGPDSDSIEDFIQGQS